VRSLRKAILRSRNRRLGRCRRDNVTLRQQRSPSGRRQRSTAFACSTVLPGHRPAKRPPVSPSFLSIVSRRDLEFYELDLFPGAGCFCGPIVVAFSFSIRVRPTHKHRDTSRLSLEGGFFRHHDANKVTANTIYYLPFAYYCESTALYFRLTCIIFYDDNMFLDSLQLRFPRIPGKLMRVFFRN